MCGPDNGPLTPYTAAGLIVVLPTVRTQTYIESGVKAPYNRIFGSCRMTTLLPSVVLRRSFKSLTEGLIRLTEICVPYIECTRPSQSRALTWVTHWYSKYTAVRPRITQLQSYFRDFFIALTPSMYNPNHAQRLAMLALRFVQKKSLTISIESI